MVILIGGLSFSFWINDQFTYSRYYAWDGEIINIYTIISYCLYIILVFIIYNYRVDKFKQEYVHIKLPFNSINSDKEVYEIDMSGLNINEIKNINIETILNSDFLIENIDFSFNNIKKIEKSFCDTFPSNSNYNFFRNGLKNKNIDKCVKCNYLKTKCKITKK